MWWLFEKLSETASQVAYRYSRESQDCDGKIVFDKKRYDIIDFQHSHNDHSEFDKKTAIDKFACFVADEGYPDRRRVVCG